MMGNTSFDPSKSVREAFLSFMENASLFALPLRFSGSTLQPLTAIAYPKDPRATFQAALTPLDAVLQPRTALYVIIRRNGSLTAITFVPYLAKAETQDLYLKSRLQLVHYLGEEKFSSTIICKELGDVIDARAWDERDGHGGPWGEAREHPADCETCLKGTTEGQSDRRLKDLGHKKTKCRLCDRRMKNQIEERAREALGRLDDAGSCVQLSVDIPSGNLVLNFQSANVALTDISTKLETSKPNFTFYRHPLSSLLYFIFYSPDAALVKERMTHTMAVPGLVNIIAKESGAKVDQKIEIHDPEDLMFEEGDERIGRFRSVYLLNESVGTESRWKGMPLV